MAADDDRRVRLLQRLRPAPDPLEVDVLAVVARLVGGPDLLHRLDALAHDREALPRVGAVVAHLLDVPAGADAEQDPPAGEPVDARDLLRGHDRVALDDQADARADVDPLGRARPPRSARRTGRRCASTRAAARHRRVRSLARRRDVGVLGEEERLEARAPRPSAPGSRDRRPRRSGSSRPRTSHAGAYALAPVAISPRPRPRRRASSSRTLKSLSRWTSTWLPSAPVTSIS